MEDLQVLKDRLNKLREKPSPDLKLIIAMSNLESMIAERERKIKK